MIKQGLLSRYFEGIAVKRLRAVEADISRSNQHEYNGVNELKKILGSERASFPARFIWLADEQDALSEDGFVTWYDARENHPTRSEYRLYFPTTPVSELAKAGDTLFIAKRTNGSVMAIITPAGSTIQNQMLWLFGLPDQPELEFTAQEISESRTDGLDFAVRYILDELGIEIEEPEANALDALIEKFGLEFPKTREFSELARNSLPEISATESPDSTLLAWMDREEQLFRRLERHIIAERLRAGFSDDKNTDVDGFLHFSLSVQNRRKARAGAALENHLEAIFTACSIRFDRGPETENKNRPDFLFPSAVDYRNMQFPVARLTMLGVKSTLKDRWRQILAEAQRIPEKHLLTLEPRISDNQTAQMKSENIRLVIPAGLQDTYRKEQKKDLMSLSNFIDLVRSRQS